MVVILLTSTIKKCAVQPINLHPNEYSWELNYYSSAINLNRCVGSCNTLENLSSRVCIPNETQDLNLHFYDMISGKNESKILA